MFSHFSQPLQRTNWKGSRKQTNREKWSCRVPSVHITGYFLQPSSCGGQSTLAWRAFVHGEGDRSSRSTRGAPGRAPHHPSSSRGCDLWQHSRVSVLLQSWELQHGSGWVVSYQRKRVTFLTPLLFPPVPLPQGCSCSSASGSNSSQTHQSWSHSPSSIPPKREQSSTSQAQYCTSFWSQGFQPLPSHSHLGWW